MFEADVFPPEFRVEFVFLQNEVFFEVLLGLSQTPLVFLVETLYSLQDFLVFRFFGLDLLLVVFQQLFLLGVLFLFAFLALLSQLEIFDVLLVNSGLQLLIHLLQLPDLGLVFALVSVVLGALLEDLELKLLNFGLQNSDLLLLVELKLSDFVDLTARNVSTLRNEGLFLQLSFQEVDFAIFLPQVELQLQDLIKDLFVWEIVFEAFALHFEEFVRRLQFRYFLSQEQLVFQHLLLFSSKRFKLYSKGLEFLFPGSHFGHPIDGGVIEFLEVGHEVGDLFVLNSLESSFDFALELFLIEVEVIFDFLLVDQGVYSQSEFLIVELRVLDVCGVNVAALQKLADDVEFLEVVDLGRRLRVSSVSFVSQQEGLELVQRVQN